MTQENNIDRIQLDEVLKSLFTVSNKVLVTMMNSLFHESFDPEQTEISCENNEFVKSSYDIIEGDFFRKITHKSKPYHYHIEFQTRNDNAMIIRMFEYGYEKAKELARNETLEQKVLYFPKQLVIFVEENRNIKDVMKLGISFPDGQPITYAVPVMKYWQYSDQDILKLEIYPLLPLQVFKLRYKMEKLRRDNGINNDKLKLVMQEAKSITEKISFEARDLLDQGVINTEDFHKILLANKNLFDYLNKRYVNDEELETEVIKMTRTLYDPEVEERGKIKGIQKIAVKLIQRGMSNQEIQEITDLDVKTINDLRKTI